jgi:hypothetical protein
LIRIILIREQQTEWKAFLKYGKELTGDSIILNRQEMEGMYNDFLGGNHCVELRRGSG